MKFLVFKNANGLGLTSDLVINWTSVKYIRPHSSSIFYLQLNNDSQIKFTVNAGNSADVIKSINDNITANPTARIIKINPKSIGAFSFTSIEYLEGGNFISNRHTVYVSADGTEAENGQALLDGYQEALSKIETVNSSALYGVMSLITNIQNEYQIYLSGSGIGGATAVLNTPYNFNVDLGTVFLDGVDTITGAQDYTFEITSLGSPASNRMTFVVTLNGRRAEGISWPFSVNQIPVLTSESTPSTLAVGPGTYNLPSDLVINNLVSMVSLLGLDSTTIKGSNVKIESGVDSSSKPQIYKGFTIDSKIYVASNLPNTTFEDIHAGSASFQPETGVGTASSIYINCAASSAFGRGTGASCSGTFIECFGQSSFGGDGGNTSGQFYRCGYDNSTSSSSSSKYGNGEYMYGYQGAEFSGRMLYCVGDYYSFASRMSTGTITSNARFDHCTCTGYRAFAAKTLNNSGTFVNCISAGNQSFSYEIPSGGDHSNAKYINCTAQSSLAFGCPISGGTAFTGKCINCTALGSLNFGKRGGSDTTQCKIYNCYSNDGFASTSGAGTIRNCLDGTGFTIINS